MLRVFLRKSDCQIAQMDCKPAQGECNSLCGVPFGLPLLWRSSSKDPVELLPTEGS